MAAYLRYSDVPLRALIFDVDGTLAETEESHRAAFNRTFAEFGYAWLWDVEQYRNLLRVTGGQQRIGAFLRSMGRAVPAQEIAALHARKNTLYSAMVASGEVQLRPGVLRLLDEARRAGLSLAIATTTSRSNLQALLQHAFPADAESWFVALVTGEDVSAKKPDPEVYLKALTALGVAAADAVAIEDSRNGLVAASACRIQTIVTPSFYTFGEDFSEASLVSPDLDNPLMIDVSALARLVERPRLGAISV